MLSADRVRRLADMAAVVAMVLLLMPFVLFGSGTVIAFQQPQQRGSTEIAAIFGAIMLVGAVTASMVVAAHRKE